VKDFAAYGHYVSKVDPLNHRHGKINFEEITNFCNIETSSIDKKYWDTQIDFKLPYSSEKINTPRELFEVLRKIYCGKIAFEYLHMS